jgi:Flp pilus assembly protein TadD
MKRRKGGARPSKRSGPDKRQVQESVELLKQPKPRHSDLLDDQFAMAENHFRYAEFELALAAFREVLDLQPENYEVLIKMGLACGALTHFEEAVSHLEKAIVLQPASPQGHHILGLLYSQRGKELCHMECLNIAEVSLRKALTLEPNLIGAHHALGNVLVEQRRLSEAENYYYQSFARTPMDANLHCDMGYLLQEQGRLREAMIYVRNALAFDAGHIQAHNNLAYLLLVAGDLENGLAEHEWRLKLPQRLVRSFSTPMWDGWLFPSQSNPAAHP